MDIGQKTFAIAVFLTMSLQWHPAIAQQSTQSSFISSDKYKIKPLPYLRVASIDESTTVNTNQIPTDTDAEDTTSSDKPEQTETIGEEPPEDISRLFLRESEVLLKPMEVQFTTGFEYRKKDTRNLGLIRNRDVSVPLSISIGLTERFELFASLPLLYSQSESVPLLNQSRKTDDHGYGDTSFGFSFKLRNETQSFPSITGSLSQTSPTGSKGDPDDPRTMSFTSGFTSQSIGLSMTKSVDPAVLFMNLGYTYVHEKQENGERVKPGSTFNYGFGSGFSINSAISLSGRLSGSYTQDFRSDGERIIGSGGEAVSFNLSLTYGINNRTRMETSVDFGLNDDASDVAIAFSYIYSLKKPGT